MSQYTPPQFSAFGKSGLFQVYDKDALEHTVRLVNRNQASLNFDGSIVCAPKGTPRGVVKFSGVNSCVVPDVAVDATLQSDASKASTLTMKKKNVLANVPGLNLSLTESTSERDFSGKPKYGVFGTMALDYTRNNATMTGSVTTDGDANLALGASASVGFEGFSVGGDIKLTKTADNALSPKSYNAGMAYSWKRYTLAAVSDQKFEKAKITALAAKLGSKQQYNVGVQAKVDVQAPKSGAPQREISVGVEQALTPDSSYRFAAVSNGTFLMAVEHRLKNPNIMISSTVVTGRPGSVYAPWPVTKFGVGITFGDY